MPRLRWSSFDFIFIQTSPRYFERLALGLNSQRFRSFIINVGTYVTLHADLSERSTSSLGFCYSARCYLLLSDPRRANQEKLSRPDALSTAHGSFTIV